MASRQKTRSIGRQPVEQQVHLALQDVAGARATIHIEVQDHGGIRGGVITANLNSHLPSDELEALQRYLVTTAKNSIPSDHPLATWSLVIQHHGQNVSVTHWFEV